MSDTWQSIEQAAVSLGLSVRTINRHMAAGKLASRLNADGRREVLVQIKGAASDTTGPFADDVLAGRVSQLERSSSGSTFDNVTGANAVVDLTTTPVNLKTLSDRLGQLDSHVTQVVTDERAVPLPSGDQSVQAARSYDSETLLVLADTAADKMERAVGAYQVLARTAVAQAEAGRRGSRIAWSAVGVMAVAIVAAIGWTTYFLTHAQSNIEHLTQEARSANETARTVSLERDTLRGELAKTQQAAAKAEGRLSALEEIDRQRHDTRPTTRPALGDQLSSFLFGH